MQKAVCLHSDSPIMRTELRRKSGGMPGFKQETALCLRTDPCEADSLSMSQGLRACVSSLRARRAVWAIMGPSGTEVWGEAQLLSCSLYTEEGITARSTLIVGLLREKEWWIIGLIHHPGPVLAVSFKWCGCELRKARAQERVTEKSRCVLSPFIPTAESPWRTLSVLLCVSFLQS